MLRLCVRVEDLPGKIVDSAVGDNEVLTLLDECFQELQSQKGEEAPVHGQLELLSSSFHALAGERTMQFLNLMSLKWLQDFPSWVDVEPALSEEVNEVVGTLLQGVETYQETGAEVRKVILFLRDGTLRQRLLATLIQEHAWHAHPLIRQHLHLRHR